MKASNFTRKKWKFVILKKPALHQESRWLAARIAELQREPNDLERERNSSMEKLAENIKRPLVSAESFGDTSKTS